MQPYNIDDLLGRAKKAAGDPVLEEKLKRETIGSLSSEQKRKLEAALDDPESLKRLLSSPAAQSIMKKLGKKE